MYYLMLRKFSFISDVSKSSCCDNNEHRKSTITFLNQYRLRTYFIKIDQRNKCITLTTDNVLLVISESISTFTWDKRIGIRIGKCGLGLRQPQLRHGDSTKGETRSSDVLDLICLIPGGLKNQFECTFLDSMSASKRCHANA